MTYTKISCCLECAADYLPKARYALTSLLRPIRLEPNWVGRDEVDPGGIYYGPNPDPIDTRVLRIPLAAATERYFASRTILTEFPPGRDAEGMLRLFPLVAGDTGPADRHLLDWDPIASAFYLLSSWQEWVDRSRDVHGRFPYAKSLQSRFDLAYDPMVDRYRRFLRTHLEDLGHSVRRRLWNGRGSAVCITHDIDYHRKWRPGILYGETVKHVLRGEPGGRIRETGRLATAVAMSAMRGDPFRRSLDAMLDAETVAGFGSTWFLKAGAHGPYDVDYSLERGWISRAIDRLENGGFEIGLHASYFAADHPGYVEKEQTRLQNVLSIGLQSIRSHYLRWFVGETGRTYEETGFLIDSTLGFAEQEGFRNATTVPFRLFDLVANKPLEIWEIPVAVMDTTLFGYRDMDLAAGIDATLELLDATREFGGVLVVLWHNIMLDSLGDPRIAPHFNAILERLDAKDVYVAALRDALAVWLDQTAATTLGDE